jgi:uncharacterized membrane protein YvlD (DUF360 family)
MPERIHNLLQGIWDRFGWWTAFAAAVLLAILVWLLIVLTEGRAVP